MSDDGQDKGRYQRIADLGEEDGEVRSPLRCIFPPEKPVSSLEDAMDAIVEVLPNWRMGGKSMNIAMRHAKKVANKYTWMTLDEIAAIVIYTMECSPREDSLYYAMNKALRNKNRKALEPWVEYIWCLLHALKKIPPSKTMKLYQGAKINLEGMHLEDLDKGEFFSWAAFSSAATTDDVVNTFLGDSGDRTLVQIQMTSKIGRDLTDFSLVPNETEVLLPPNISFELASKEECAPGYWMVQVTQTESVDEILDMSVEEENETEKPKHEEELTKKAAEEEATKTVTEEEAAKKAAEEEFAKKVAEEEATKKAAEEEAAKKAAEELEKSLVVQLPVLQPVESERSRRLREIRKYNEELLAEVSKSPNRKLGGVELPMLPQRSRVGPSPSAANDVDVTKVRPSTPIDDAVKYINFTGKHRLAYASKLDEQVEQAQERLAEYVNRNKQQCEAFLDFKRQCHEKALTEKREREWVVHKKVLAEEKRVLNGFAQAKKSQSPMRKRAVVKSDLDLA